MRTAVMVAGIAGAIYLLGRRAGDQRKHDSLYQRAALLWTSPGAVRPVGFLASVRSGGFAPTASARTPPADRAGRQAASSLHGRGRFDDLGGDRGRSGPP